MNRDTAAFRRFLEKVIGQNRPEETEHDTHNTRIGELEHRIRTMRHSLRKAAKVAKTTAARDMKQEDF